MAEVDAADGLHERADEIGDLLFAAVNWARKLGVDPEAALHQATTKFERRFRAMEVEAGATFPTLSLDQMEALWQRVKRRDG
jgi:nucleoside triphosphate diphosphatase